MSELRSLQDTAISPLMFERRNEVDEQRARVESMLKGIAETPRSRRAEMWRRTAKQLSAFLPEQPQRDYFANEALRTTIGAYLDCYPHGAQALLCDGRSAFDAILEAHHKFSDETILGCLELSEYVGSHGLRDHLITLHEERPELWKSVSPGCDTLHWVETADPPWGFALVGRSVDAVHVAEAIGAWDRLPAEERKFMSNSLLVVALPNLAYYLDEAKGDLDAEAWFTLISFHRSSDGAAAWQLSQIAKHFEPESSLDLAYKMATGEWASGDFTKLFRLKREIDILKAGGDKGKLLQKCPIRGRGEVALQNLKQYAETRPYWK